MSYYTDEIEKIIGPSHMLIVAGSHRDNLIRWAQTKLNGKEIPKFPRDLRDAGQLSNVELTNLYHSYGPGATPPPVSSAFGDLVRHVERTGFAPTNVATINTLIAENLENYNELALVDMQRLIDAAIAALPPPVPMRIELVDPNGFTRPLEGLHHHMTGDIIQHASLGDAIMMVGPAGCGKTTIGEMTAKALNLPFKITSTVSDTFELTGFVDGHGFYHRTAFRDAFEHGGVWVADEIDAWDAGALLTANSALANGYITFPDNQIPVNRHADFRMIACANTFGKGADRVYIGRNQLDAASLDRFTVVAVDYDRSLESHLGGGNLEWVEFIWKVREKVEQKNIRHVVSTRAIIRGSRALAIGMDRKKVEERYLWKGLPEADQKKIIDGPGWR